MASSRIPSRKQKRTARARVPAAAARRTIDIGSRLELFVDDFLIDTMNDVRLHLHAPVPRDVAILFDAPWEGNTCAYWTVFPDGDRARMYYRGSNYDWATKKESEQFTCYAESRDGLNWEKPSLGLFPFAGSTQNNIVWQQFGTHNFIAFRDANPKATPEEQYKGLVGHKNGLCALKSPDGLHWSPMQDEPVITKGAFDSQNLAFWDTVRGRYVEYHRDFRRSPDGKHGVRDIMTSTSDDFLHWSDPEWLDYGDAPLEHLYTNAITPYPRAPHIFMGFPKRFVPSRTVPHHPAPGVSDGVFMTSRDGVHWKRWGEALIRPGPQKERWVNRNNMTAWGILITRSGIPGTPDGLSIYSSEGYYVKDCRLRRYALRLDGFVSVRADLRGGEFITKPFRFQGSHLRMNYATSAAGSLRVEVQTASGKPIHGRGLEDCHEVYGDEIEGEVTWGGQRDLSALSGKPVRLRIVMKDADLYAIRFVP